MVMEILTDRRMTTMARQSIKRAITKTVARITLYRIIDQVMDYLEGAMSSRKSRTKAKNETKEIEQ